MIDFLKEIDASILIAINSFGNPHLNEIMWFLTNKFTWFPFYLFLFIIVYLKSNLKQFIAFTLIGFITIGLADFTASKGLKNNVKRYRPSHHLELQNQLNFYETKPGEHYKGGQYGFVSGHATNSFAIALFFGLFLKRRFKYALHLLLFWAVLVSYTRLYLGVHYPSDILGGCILGLGISYLCFQFYLKVEKKITPNN